MDGQLPPAKIPTSGRETLSTPEGSIAETTQAVPGTIGGPSMAGVTSMNPIVSTGSSYSSPPNPMDQGSLPAEKNN